MEKRPKVSVVVPVYNVEKYIQRCLESAVNQTMSDIEIIIINDGSPDNSVEIVKKYMQTDSRIRLYEKENGGLASARNRGIDLADGEIVMFLDSDDYLALNACEVIYQAYMSTKADVIVYGANLFPEFPEADPWLRKKLDTRDILYRSFSPQILLKEAGGSPFAWNKAFALSFLKSVGIKFDERVKYGEDLVYCFEILPYAKKIQFIKDRLYYYQWYRTGSLMNTVAMEKEKMLFHHVYNLHIITRFWYKKKWLRKWRAAFEIWFVYFILPDVMRADKKVKMRCLEKCYHMTKQYGMLSQIVFRMFMLAENTKEVMIKNIRRR